MTATPWTEERIETLKTLWRIGMSGAKIAEKMGGTTRSAVIGKVSRLGLPSRDTDPALRRPPFSDSPNFMRKRKAQTIDIHALECVQPERKFVLPDIPKPKRPPVPKGEKPDMLMLTIEELRYDSCRWPVGEPFSESFRYCGCRRGNGRTYCDYHHALSVRSRAA